jgi:hypothetical protein
MLKKLKDTPLLLAFRWSLMLAAIFWTLVYKLSETGVKVPDFVYVNF